MSLSDFLDEYLTTWGDTEKLVPRFRELLKSPGCFDRTHLPGHFTGSALVVTEQIDRVLLTHHRKLSLWLQLGGHADGDPNLDEVALREAREESGLIRLEFLPFGTLFGRENRAPLALDLDIHRIPAHGAEPGHEHYDVRFVVAAKDPEKIILSEESHELKWLDLEEAYGVTEEPSMHRMFDKLKRIRSAQKFRL